MFKITSYDADKNGTIGISVGLDGLTTHIDDNIEGVPAEDLERAEKSLTSAIDSESKKEYGIFFTLGQVSVGIICALILMVIFLYKKINLQLRMARLLFVLLLGMFVAFIFGASYGEGIFEGKISYLQNILGGLGGNEGGDITLNYEVGAFLPIVAAAFMFLANIHIKKDIKLIKSVDRLR